MDEKLEFSWKWRNDFSELELSKWSNKAQESKPIKALKKCWISRPSFIDNAAAWRPQRPPIVCLTSKRESLFFSGRVFLFPVHDSSRKTRHRSRHLPILSFFFQANYLFISWHFLLQVPARIKFLFWAIADIGNESIFFPFPRWERSLFLFLSKFRQWKP